MNEAVSNTENIEDTETIVEYTKSALSTLAILFIPVLTLWASFA
jgi:hypothetical protein